ncbi:putative sugar transferase EpsL [Symmachiella dynata]|uniref:Putative sugar transferase EpsL n=1 Tax=Symmachiella dynata TaxID=2527995 RepID=A0A517ZJV5_9PLAN|nr:sugar transferase [Symmachiella dynata]QDU42769.1 putative sugar transferase EpsL [Symmachiella dynata]
MSENGTSGQTATATLHSSLNPLYSSPNHPSGSERTIEPSVRPRTLRRTVREAITHRPESKVTRREKALYAFAKRALDVFVTGSAILVLSPLFIAIAVAIRLTSRGPAIYKHTRVGLRGREFTCYKFRSMSVDADRQKDKLREKNQHKDSRTFKMANDPRITPIGRLLRKSSFDELPQLFNVLLGDMSLVGPRPPVPSEVEQYSWDDLRRLEVKPGLTCIWQVSGRSNIPFPKQLQMDIEYIERQSLLFDLQLLLRTVPAVLSAKGAY